MCGTRTTDHATTYHAITDYNLCDASPLDHAAPDDTRRPDNTLGNSRYFLAAAGSALAAWPLAAAAFISSKLALMRFVQMSITPSPVAAARA